MQSSQVHDTKNVSRFIPKNRLKKLARNVSSKQSRIMELTMGSSTTIKGAHAYIVLDSLYRTLS